MPDTVYQRIAWMRGALRATGATRGEAKLDRERSRELPGET